MNDIAKKQNEPNSIRKLVAQRHLYQQSRHIAIWSFGLCIILPCVMALLQNWICNAVLNDIVVVTCVLGTIGQYLSLKHQDEKKQLAARIQQKFDAYVYGMKWLNIWGKEPTLEEILTFAEEGKTEGLENWYEPEVSEMNESIGVILCQFENVSYDMTLRKQFYKYCTFLFCVILALSCLCCFYYNIKFNTIVLQILFPIMPFIVWYLHIYSERDKDLLTLEFLQNKVQQVWNDGAAKDIAEEDLLEIQTILLRHRECAHCIPNVIYKLLRHKQEEKIYYSTKERISDWKKHHNKEHNILMPKHKSVRCNVFCNRYGIELLLKICRNN